MLGQSLFSGLRAPELGRVKSAPGSEALWTTWSVGGAAPGHMRADKLRRSNRSQALCESTSSYGGRHRLPCGRAQTMCPCYDSKTQLSEPPVHPLLLASPGQAPAASLGHWLPAPYIYIYILPDSLCKTLQITELSVILISPRRQTCRRKAFVGPVGKTLWESASLFSSPGFTRP